MPKVTRVVLLLVTGLAWSAAGAQSSKAEGDAAITVRHDVAQAGDPVVTLRYFRIRKGSFPEFLKASEEGVWPFFEKIGSRVIGMWQVIHPAEAGATAPRASPDYDEVWLMTRYASVEHWQATRDMAGLGGNGPDYDKARKALELRDSLTLETSVQFLQGTTWQNPPVYLPSID